MKDYQTQVGRENLRLARGCFVRNLIATVMSLILFVSMFLIAVAVGTKPAGYFVVAYNTETQEQKVLYEFHYDGDAEDTRFAEVEKQHPAPWQLQKQGFRTDLSDGASTTVTVLAQLFSLILLFAFFYGRLWSRGDSDHNLVQFGRIERDPLRGLKIGLLAEIPYAAVWLFLLLGKCGVAPRAALTTFVLANFHLVSIVSTATAGLNNATQMSWLSVILLALTLAVVPLCCHVAYTLGYHRISVKERLIYRRDGEKKDAPKKGR